MNDKIKNSLGIVLLTAGGLALGAGAVAFLKPAPVHGYVPGDYSDLQREVGAEVLLFTIPGCDYCRMTREWLTARYPGFREISLAEYPEYRGKLAKLTDVPGVPVTILGSTLVAGYNEKHLAAALQAYQDTERF